ncbi:MAG TPA: alpha-galactosidase, partial [Mycobacteriales bacterium]|nr:alpha-galactosidase [Mycobacteriales bacterium]
MDIDAEQIRAAVLVDGEPASGERPAARILPSIVRRPGTALLECTVRVEARRDIRIQRLDPVVLDVDSAGCELLQWSSGWGAEFEPVRGPLTGRRIVETTSGRSSHGRHPFVVVSGDRGVLAVAVAWSGNWRIAFEPTERGHRITAGAYPVDLELAAGESFESPRVVLATGADLNEIGVQFGRVGRAHWYPAGDPLPNEWNHWWTYEDSRIDARVFTDNARRAGELGLGAATLDAGWFGPSDQDSHWLDYRGDWDLVNSARFPDGIPALARDVRESGLRFGIWCEIEAVGAKARLRQEHPEFLATRGGRDLGYACFGNPAVRSWAEGILSRLAAEGAGWIKLDFNLDPGLGCDRTDHGHGAGDGLFAHYRGYYATLDRVRAAHPGLILENCSSGGLRIDLEMLRHTDATFLSDPDWPEH